MTQAQTLTSSELDADEELAPLTVQDQRVAQLLSELSKDAYELLDRSVVNLELSDPSMLTGPYLAAKVAEVRNLSGEASQLLAHAQAALKMIDLKILGLKARHDKLYRDALGSHPRVRAKVSADERKEAAKVVADEEVAMLQEKWQRSRAECAATLEILQIIYKEVDHARTDVGRANDIWRTQTRLEV